MIRVNLDLCMVKAHVQGIDLAQRIDLTPTNLSILKNNKAKAIRLSTLDALCRELGCQPGDILEYVEDE